MAAGLPGKLLPENPLCFLPSPLPPLSALATGWDWLHPVTLLPLKGTNFAPIFAQQSVRENARTGRTPQQVLDDAQRAVEAAHWDAPWGADADHLKSPDDLPPFVDRWLHILYR